jgi:thioesterase domain-containing protein
MGRQVAFLGLIETYAHLKPSFFNYSQRIAAVAQWRPADYIDYVNFKLKRRFHHDWNIEQLDFISRRFANSSSEQAINNMKLIYRYNIEAAAGYYMQHYDGKVSLFMAKETLKGKIPLPCYGWKGLSQAIDLHTFDSSHSDILRESYAASVAEEIVKCITAAGV